MSHFAFIVYFLIMVGIDKIYFGLQGGYYFDYCTFSAYAQAFLYKTTSLRLVYDKIDNADFLNIGLHYTLYR